MAEIKLENVTFRYPGSESATLDNLQLHINQGEAHALLGASGAGKTTLLNLLSGILTPTSGRILFDGADVSALPGRARRVAQVFQFPVLYESLSVRDNLAFPMRQQKSSKAQIEERVAYVAAELSLAHVLQARPRQLSLYQKQLVAVGKALMRPDVSLVLLDEPLTAVEPGVKWSLRQVLRRAQTDLGVTMIYVTHDQTEALTFADRVSVLTTEGIAQTGTPQQIYNEPAHQFVGHFVGSPGMNFVSGHVFPVAQSIDADTLGFRPEWAQLSNQPQGQPSMSPLTGVVSRMRPTGIFNDRPQGIVTVETDYGAVQVAGSLAHQTGDQVAVVVQRYVLYRDQVRVNSGEF